MKGLLILLTAMLVLAGIALAVSRGRRPLVCLYLIVITAPLEVYRTNIGGFNVSLFRLSLAAAFGVIAIEFMRERRLGLRKRWLRDDLEPRLPVAYVAFALIVAVALAVNPINTFVGVRQLAILLIGVLAVALVAILVRRTSVEDLARAMVFSAVLPMLAGAWQAIAPRLKLDPTLPLVRHLVVPEGLDVNVSAPVTLDNLTVRTKGTFGDPNHFGVYLMIVLMVTLALAIAASRERDTPSLTAWSAACVASAITLVTSYSRTAWIGALAAMLVFLALERPALRQLLTGRRRRLALATFLTMVAAAAVPVVPNIRERANPDAALNVESNSAHERTIRAAIAELKEHPIIGGGPGALGAELEQGRRTSVADSSYFTAAAELGVVGLLALLTAGGLALWRLLAFRSAPPAPVGRLLAVGFSAAYAGFLIANFTYDLWYDDFHWILVGAASSVAAAWGPRRRWPETALTTRGKTRWSRGETVPTA